MDQVFDSGVYIRVYHCARDAGIVDKLGSPSRDIPLRPQFAQRIYRPDEFLIAEDMGSASAERKADVEASALHQVGEIRARP